MNAITFIIMINKKERGREKYLQRSVEDFCAATANISLWLRKYFFSGATTRADTQIATHKFIAALQIGVGGRGNNAEEVMKKEEKEEEGEEEEKGI